MGYCPNCKSKLTCGCQKRKAKDGSSACEHCVISKNTQLAAIANTTKPPVNSPTNIKSSYKGPGQQV